MTMLDRMRRHKSWLKWSLVVVVATFILLYVPSFLSPTATGAAPGDAIATVNGEKITVDSYQPRVPEAGAGSCDRRTARR